MYSSELTTNLNFYYYYSNYSLHLLCNCFCLAENMKYNITYKYAIPMSIPCRVTTCICNKLIFSILFVELIRISAIYFCY